MKKKEIQKIEDYVLINRGHGDVKVNMAMKKKKERKVKKSSAFS